MGSHGGHPRGSGPRINQRARHSVPIDYSLQDPTAVPSSDLQTSTTLPATVSGRVGESDVQCWEQIHHAPSSPPDLRMKGALASFSLPRTRGTPKFWPLKNST